MSISKHGAFSSPPSSQGHGPATRAQVAPPSVPSALDAWEPTRAFDPAAQPLSSRPRADAWQATRMETVLATQFLKDENDYLSGASHDIGRQTAAYERELFVSCDPALALQQQFEHLRPEYIAVHDIATASSRKLLLGIAAACGRGVHKLLIRRQGYGTPLATLEFVELPTVGATPVRLFTTETDADTAARHGLARILLGFSRLAAVLVGDLPGHAMAAAVQSLGGEIAEGPWPNRDLLLLPLVAGSQLSHQGAELGRITGVNVRTTPQVLRPADAWAFVTATWTRLRSESALGGAALPELVAFRSDHEAASAGRGGPAPAALTTPRPTTTTTTAPTAPTTPTPAPGKALSVDAAPAAPLVLRALPGRGPAEATTSCELLERYVRHIGELKGVLCCCVFEVDTGRTVAQAGADPRGDELATRGMALLAAVRGATARLDAGEGCPEVAVSLDTCHLVLRSVPTQPQLALHALLDRQSGNLTLVRLQVQRLDNLFEPIRTA